MIINFYLYFYNYAVIKTFGMILVYLITNLV